MHALHGLCVRSEIPLPERRCSRPADVYVSWEHDLRNTTAPPGGEVVAHVEDPSSGYTLVEDERGWVLRYPGFADFDFSRDGRRIGVHAVPGLDRDLIPILLSGNVLGVALALRGEAVLHASAVQSNGINLAIVGASGMGKSTVTALLCADGATLVSDDLLRVECRCGGAYCFEGTRLIRLRPAAAELAEAFPAAVAVPTADGRLAIAPKRARGTRFQLDAALVPRPSRAATRVRVERLAVRDALVELVSNPRVLGWTAAEPNRLHFSVMADLAQTVPVYRAEIPWGPPFPLSLAAELLDELSLAGTALQ